MNMYTCHWEKEYLCKLTSKATLVLQASAPGSLTVESSQRVAAVLEQFLSLATGEGLEAWVNIPPKNPYLAKQVVLENLILLKSKKDDF